MNVYDSFFRSMSPEEWEFFAIDFLKYFWEVSVLEQPARGVDGGSDALLELGDGKWMVSCKHYYNSNKSVGLDDENSILDRMAAKGADGFIGFYSTVISTGLQKRLFDMFRHRNERYHIFDRSRIMDMLPGISSHIFQKYGLPKNVGYFLNVAQDDYKPLICLGDCGKDLLENCNILKSIAMVIPGPNNNLEYIYGCKDCLRQINAELGYVEVSQVLHCEQMLGWIVYVNDLLEGGYTPSHNFYKNRYIFESLIRQKAFPSNWGTWWGF